MKNPLINFSGFFLLHYSLENNNNRKQKIKQRNNLLKLCFNKMNQRTISLDLRSSKIESRTNFPYKNINKREW
jgi:hypothetical protein